MSVMIIEGGGGSPEKRIDCLQKDVDKYGLQLEGAEGRDKWSVRLLCAFLNKYLLTPLTKIRKKQLQVLVKRIYSYKKIEFCLSLGYVSRSHTHTRAHI